MPELEALFARLDALTEDIDKAKKFLETVEVECMALLYAMNSLKEKYDPPRTEI